MIWILLFVAALELAAWVVVTYNGLVRRRQMAEEG